MSPQETEQLQEGFFPQQIIIQQHALNSRPQQRRPTDYQPRVLRSHPITKKLPTQMNAFFEQMPTIQTNQILMDQDMFKPSLSQSKQQAKSIFDKYERDSNQFQLVYSKAGVVLEGERDNFAKRQIYLSCITRYQQLNYTALQPYQYQQQNQSHLNKSIEFDSKFESGNLMRVYKHLNTNDYHLIAQNDTNTYGYNQWLFFSIKHPTPGKKYTFKIVNLRKKFSFYKVGMKPVIFSLQKHVKTGNGWFRKGQNVTYTDSQIYDTKLGQMMKLYCLSFQISFESSTDFITISLGMPYTYTRLMQQLKECKQNALNSQIFWEQKTIAHTISNNQVPYLTVTKSQSINQLKKYKEIKSNNKKISNKKCIVILARQHPGETNSSFLMEKILISLSTIYNNKIDWLLQKFQFRIFPMINVDGVIYGNFRCDLAGFDINRTWKSPMRQIHPQIHAIKQQILKLQKNNQIVACIDLHSHSSQYNIFAFCSKKDEIISRLFAYMLSKSTFLFKFPFCTFGLTRSNQGTARGVITEIIKHSFCITIESSYFAAKNNKEQVVILQPRQFEEMAHCLMSTISSYFHNDKNKQKLQKEVKQNIDSLMQAGSDEQQRSGSDSEPEQDQGDIEQKLKRIIPIQVLLAIKRRMQNQKLKEEAQRRQNQQIQVILDEDSQSLLHLHPIRTSQVKKNQKRIKKIKITKQSKQFISIQLNHSQMQVNRIDRKLILRTPTHKWRSNWTKERIRTQAKHQTFDQNNHLFVKCENDYADLLDDNQFKKSMKMLYNQLRSNRNQQRTTQRYKGLGESCLILENKDYQTEEKKNSPNKKLSKFQKILRIRRKGSIFKSCLGKNEQDEQQNYSAIKISSQLYSQDQINSGSDLSKSELSYFLKDSDNRGKLHSSKGGTGLINSSVIHKLLRQNRKCLKQGQMKLKAEC